MERIIADDADNPGHYYDKTCFLSRMGKCDEAVTVLATVFEKGYRHFAHMTYDDDIDPIRKRRYSRRHHFFLGRVFLRSSAQLRLTMLIQGFLSNNKTLEQYYD